MSKLLLLLCLLTCLMLRGLVKMFVHGETKQKIIMHNCCFLTILNELTFLLYPLGYLLCIKPSA